MSQMVKSEKAPAATRAERPERIQTIAPTVNIHQDADGYTLVVDMPGVSKSGVDVSFEDGKLILGGRRSFPTDGGEAIHRESTEADYRRVFDLDPSIDAGKIEAGIEQGVLTLRLPKSEAAKPRKIEVR